MFLFQSWSCKFTRCKKWWFSKDITSKYSKVYRNNVFVYADMNNYQNVSVFVTGNVNKPGLYQGLSSDSIIQYIDKASGYK